MSFKFGAAILSCIFAINANAETGTYAGQAKNMTWQNSKKPAPLTMKRTNSTTTKKYIYEVKGGTTAARAEAHKLMSAGGNCTKVGVSSYACSRTITPPKKVATPSTAGRSTSPSGRTSSAQRKTPAKKPAATKPPSDEILAADKKLDNPELIQNVVPDVNFSENSGVDSTGCVAKFSSEGQACSRSFSTATNSCNKDSSQNQGMFGQFASSASAITKQLASLSSSSVALACSDIGKLSMAASNTLSMFKDKCVGAQQSCIDHCGDYREKVRECITDASASNTSNSDINVELADALGDLSDSVSTCESFERQIADADQSLQGTVGSMNNAANCENAVAGDDFCKSNPTNPACANNKIVESCANEDYAKTNLTCICLKNPAAEGCGINAGGASGAGPSGGLIPLPGSTDPDTSDLIDDDNAIAPVAGSGGAGEELSGQKGGGSGGLEGSGGGPGGPDGRGSGGKSGVAGILSGFFGGGSGSSSGGPGTASGTPGVAGAKGVRGGLGNPDLRKFMPGGLNDPRRGPASAHGINARDTDLFKIIKNAYVKQTKSLKD